MNKKLIQTLFSVYEIFSFSFSKSRAGLKLEIINVCTLAVKNGTKNLINDSKLD